MRHLSRLWDKCINAPLAALLARRRPRPFAPAEPGHWVAIKLVGMGDAVLMRAALAAVCARGARLTVLTTARTAGAWTLTGLPLRVIELERRGGLRAAFAALRSADGVLDFEQHVFWSALLVALSPLSARRVGFRVRGTRVDPLYSDLVDPGSRPRPMLECFNDIARAAGFSPGTAPPLRIGAPADHDAANWRREHGLRAYEYIVLAPGSGHAARFRRFSAARWAEIIPQLPALPLVVIGTPIDASLIEALRLQSPRPLLPALAWPLERLAALMRDAGLVLAIDSGPLHLANALGVPLVGFFGPDTPLRYGADGPASVNVSLHLPCSPCNNCFVYREAHCTNPKRYACMDQIDGDRVLAAVGQLRRSRAAGA